MNSNPNEQDWKILICAYADGALSPDDAAAAERLLAEKPECRQYLAELRKLSLSLHVLKDEQLSPDAELKIRSNIKKERSMNTNYWKPTAAVAASVLVIVLAYNNFKTSIPGEITPKGVIVQVPISVPMSQQPVATSSSRVMLANPSTPVPQQPAAMFMAAKEAVGGAARKAEMTEMWKMQSAQGRLESSTDSIGDRFSGTSTAEYEPYYVQAVNAKKDSMGSSETRLNEKRVAYGREMAVYKDPGTANGYVSDGYGKTFADRASFSVQTPVAEAGRLQNIGAVAYGTVGSGYGKVLYQPVYQDIQYRASGDEEYGQFEENQFLVSLNEPLSTFSIDVDTASYSNIRRFLSQRQMPPKDAVRIEEMINYFSYNYPQPWFGQPFSVTTDLAVCPWNSGHQLMRIGIKGKTPSGTNLPPSNLVFLIDVSGSMADADKLPLLKEGFKMMVRQLRPEDRISIVVYASNAGLVLPPTSGSDQYTILNAIDGLRAEGSTAGGEGIQLSYNIAQQTFIRGGNNRVVLATDGDFNVGVTNNSELERMIEEKRQAGIFLTVLGFGQGNIKDNRMQMLADKGNGNYFYIDSYLEAQKVLVNELGSTLFTIAKDVKIQVEFNPALVKAYRLIGYEKRMLAKEDFNNDRKDAGEIGAGHSITALYEIVPVNVWTVFEPTQYVDPLKYQRAASAPRLGRSSEVATVKLRYKDPEGDSSKLISKTVKKADLAQFPQGDFAWATAVAEVGMLLRDSDTSGNASYDQALSIARSNIGNDQEGLRSEFINLIQTARDLDPRPQPRPTRQENIMNNYQYPDQNNGRINFKE